MGVGGPLRGSAFVPRRSTPDPLAAHGSLVVSPILKQVGDLVAADFEEYPVWVDCHIVDYDEPWYDDTDEETVRPWSGTFPVDPEEATFLVSAQFRLPTGKVFPGWVNPRPFAEPFDLGFMQPRIFVAGRIYAFWGGGLLATVEERSSFYAAAGVSAISAFPIEFSALPGLASGRSAGQLEGFYHAPDFRGPALIER